MGQVIDRSAAMGKPDRSRRWSDMRGSGMSAQREGGWKSHGPFEYLEPARRPRGPVWVHGVLSSVWAWSAPGSGWSRRVARVAAGEMGVVGEASCRSD